jgi:hypothetical protein
MNSHQRISTKIRKLRHEGVSEREAVGRAYGMARANRITKSGGYRRVGKKKKSNRGRRRYNRGRKGGELYR